MTNPIADIAGADFILALGTNTTETHPVIALRVKQAVRRGARLAVADPRRTALAELAHYHLQIKPGSDIALLNSLAQVIIEEGLENKEFIAGRTEDYEAFKQTVARYTPEYAAQVTGVPAEVLRAVAREYATAPNSTILYTMGVTQHICGTHNVFAVANLALLCGQIGKPYSGVNPLRGQNNVQGACDMGGLPNVLTGYQSVTLPEVREKFARAWGVASLPEKPGLTVGEMMEAAAHGQIKAMYIMGENPLISDADAGHVAQALEKLDFLVVQDIFLTETAQLAHVVLPAASFAEKDGTFTNTERRVQRVRQAIQPLGNALPDWQIICRVAAAMGHPWRYSSPAEIMAEIAGLTPSYGGISYERLEQGGLQWPCPAPDHPGTPVLHVGQFARGKGKFHAVEYVPPHEQPDADYPFVLSTGRRYYHYHTGTMTLRTGALEVYYGREYLEVNPQDAAALGIADGDLLRVTSRRGSVEVAACLTDRVPPGMVFTSFHFPEVAINKLTNPARDAIAKIPELKVCAVRLEKAGGSAFSGGCSCGCAARA